MKRSELEHILRAAGSIVGSREIAVIGSQAILGSYPDPPAELTVSQELDVFPLDAPEKADLIDGSIGEKSPFHETFGYYAHGVSPETAVLPTGWRSRLVRVHNENTGGVSGLCLHPADLAISKLVAGRDKDIAFVVAVLRHRLTEAVRVRTAISELEPKYQELVTARLERCTREASQPNR